MTIQLDLHIHSCHSPDGSMTPEQIAALAQSRGLQAVAICDHDRVWEGRWPEGEILLIPSVEFSTEYGHLLGLFVRERVEKADFFGLVEEIHRQGGLAVLAHPFQHSRDPARLEPVAGVVDGVEVFNSRADRKIPEANALALEFARRHRLRFFAGSDAHVPEEVGNGRLELECDELTLEAVREGLRWGGGKILGRSSPARHTARSQWVKLQKKSPAPAAWAKWALFAAKCWSQDLWRRKDENHVLDRETW